MDFCRVEEQPGSNNFIKIPNPVTSNIILQIIKQWNPKNHHAVSFTGGEPLLNVSSLKVLMNQIKNMNLKILLETNGTLPEALEEVIDATDIISMDIKLPKVLGQNVFKKHQDFLRIAKKKEVYVKIVVEKDMLLDEFLESISVISKVDQNIPLVIQPVTTFNNYIAPTPRQLLNWHDKAQSKLNFVRTIPQAHKFIGQL